MFEWHPFSVSRIEGNVITFDIKAGDCASSWTRKLCAQTTEEKGTSVVASVMNTGSIIMGRLFQRVATDSDSLLVSVDGPYGHFGVDLEKYTSVCFVAGGIGITPMLSALEWILSTNASRAQKLTAVELHWSMRDSRLLGKQYL
jgi:predicted ferric reductase